MQMEETESFGYLSNVLNWKAEPFVGQRPLSPSVQFGPYNLTELIEAVYSAADASGFATYAFRGARKSAASCSIKFGCDHGRLRYGKEKDAISKKKKETLSKICRKSFTINRENVDVQGNVEATSDHRRNAIESRTRIVPSLFA
jgi:hypothetical protein